MQFTGERYVPGIHGDIELEHRHRYLLACELVRGKEVLDIASGEGYGSAMLASSAAQVIGVDLAQDAVDHASRTYDLPNLSFRQGSAAAIPLDPHCMDCVVSFETIEHLDQQQQMMQEINRVLRPGGLLIISSPDKRWYRDVPGGINPFHPKELYCEQFRELLTANFAHVVLAGQRVLYGSVIACSASAAGFRHWEQIDAEIAATSDIPRPLYDLALASDQPVVGLPNSVFEQFPTSADTAITMAAVLDVTRAELAAVRAELAGAHSALVGARSELANAQAELVNAYGSHSWRVTRPLRGIKRLLWHPRPRPGAPAIKA
jgi:ubiquinone/menaquinone biosynthesis C-methylase UbiE